MPVEESTEEKVAEDEDEAVVEDVTESEKTPKTKEIIVGEWIHMNSQPPIWMRYAILSLVARSRR